MCLYPKLIYNRKYLPNAKNGRNPPEVKDKRVLKVPVGCGNCIECKQKKARDWTVRLNEELRNSGEGVFVSLTFSNEYYTTINEEIGDDIDDWYERENETATIGVRRFLERYRKKHGVSCRHWLVTELGQKGTENVHVHGIIWAKKEDIKKAWELNGFSYLGNECSERTINYIVKYISKVDEKHKLFKSKILCSKGIGQGYTLRSDALRNKFNNKNTIETYSTRQGVKLALPIYYRNKLYTDEERERLWLNKLDQQKRYVRGTEIDVSTEEGVQKYFEALQYQQKENTRLGYQGREIEWSIKKYELEKREVNFKKRTSGKKHEQ